MRLVELKGMDDFQAYEIKVALVAIPKLEGGAAEPRQHQIYQEFEPTHTPSQPRQVLTDFMQQEQTNFIPSYND